MTQKFILHINPNLEEKVYSSSSPSSGLFGFLMKKYQMAAPRATTPMVIPTQTQGFLYHLAP